MGKKRIVKEEGAEVAEGKGQDTHADREASLPAGQAGQKEGGKRMSELTQARFYITASYNNTLISVTDAKGNVVTWSSAGALGFKGPKKATPYAASKIVEKIFEKLANMNIGKVFIYVQGIGNGRDAAIRALSSRGLDIVALEDVTPIAHNGCRPRKARRV